MSRIKSFKLPPPPYPTLPLVGDPAAFMAGKGEGLGGGKKWDFLYYKSIRRRKGYGINDTKRI